MLIAAVHWAADAVQGFAAELKAPVAVNDVYAPGFVSK